MNVSDNGRRRGWGVAVGAAVLATAISMPAQQMVTETRDPRADAGRGLRASAVKEWTTQPYFISPLVDHLPKVPGIPIAEGRARVPHRRARDADLLRRHPEVLPRAGGGHAARARSRRSASPMRTASWSSCGSRPTRTSRTLQKNRDNLAKIADPRGLTDAADPDADRDDEAALPPDGRSAQRRDRSVRDADGAGLPSRDRDVAAHQRRSART